MAKKKTETRPMNITIGDSPFDRILANHNDPEKFPLSETEQQMADRWFEAFTLMLNHRSKMWIVNQWKKRGLSQAQAYIDIRNAEAMYGNVMRANRDGATAKVTLWMEQSLERCIQKGDEKGAQRALAMMIKAFGLDKEEQAKINPEKLTNAKIELTLTKAEINVFKQMSANGQRSNFNLPGPIEDVEFEEIKDAKPHSSKTD